jgi:cytochrome P450
MALIRRLLDTPQTALDELATYGPACALGGGPLRFAVVSSPTLIRELLSMPNEWFRYDIPVSQFPVVVGPTSMIASDGEDHRRRRGAVAQALSRRRLGRWIPMIVERSDAAVAAALDRARRDGPIVDLYPIGRRLVLDIVVRALFGERLSASVDEIDAGLVSGQRFLASPLWRQLPHPFPFGVRRAAQADRKAFDSLIDEAIAASRSQPGAAEDGDLLDALVRSADLSDAEIRDQVKTLIGAGFDTTASTLAWVLWEATLCVGLWERLRSEADDVFGPLGGDRIVDDQTLAGLTLSARTVRETLRLHPASGVAARTAATTLTVGDWTIRKGTVILWSPYLAGRDPSSWTDPLRFDPDRFDDGGSHEAWLPFGRGPRACLGIALAQMELTLIIARLAQRLDLAATQPQPPPARGLIVSAPTGGAPMHLSPRAAGNRP